MSTSSISGNGRRLRSRPGRRVSRRVRYVALGGTLTVLVVVALVAGYVRDRGWVRVGTVYSLARAKVVYVSNLHLFVVGGSHPVALTDRSPRSHSRILFCPSAGYFQDRQGSAFDRFGLYVQGPAPRGLTRVSVRVKGANVDVKPDEFTLGPPRGWGSPTPAAGALCDPGDPQNARGFLPDPTS